MRAFGCLAAGAFLVGCGAANDTEINLQHDACAPLALVSDAPTDAQHAGMMDGQALWRDHGAPAVGLRADTTVNVVFEDAAAAFHGLYDDTTGVIYINRELTDPKELSIVIAHELGHAFGLPHITDRSSVMNPGNLRVVPNDQDAAALEALWGPCQ